MYVCLQILDGFNILIKQPKFPCHFNLLSVSYGTSMFKEDGKSFFK